MDNRQQKKNSSAPSDLHTVVQLVISFLKKCEPNMIRLKDKEQLKALIETFTHKGTITGQVRDIKPTGVVRHVDGLGRVVIPIELRRTIGLAEDASLEIYTDNSLGHDWVVLKAYNMQKCVFCESTDHVTPHKDKFICENCIEEIFNKPSVVGGN